MQLDLEPSEIDLLIHALDCARARAVDATHVTSAERRKRHKEIQDLEDKLRPRQPR